MTWAIQTTNGTTYYDDPEDEDAGIPVEEREFRDFDTDPLTEEEIANLLEHF